MNPVDKMMQGVSLSQARERHESVWREINAALLSHAKIPRTLYFDALLNSACLMKARMEEKGDFSEDLWGSYRQLLGHCVLTYGTVDVPKVLRLYEGVVKAVLRFPSRPYSLLQDYTNAVTAQRERFQAAYARQQEAKSRGEAAAKGGPGTAPSPETPPMPKPVDPVGVTAASAAAAAAPAPPDLPQPDRPDIEYDGALSAVVPALAPHEVLRLLNDIPTRMCLAHRNGILRLKLTNPLAIPACTYVTTGYGCDTCRRQGLHVAYQAMLYDTEEEEAEEERALAAASAGGGRNEVRSQAQIAKKRFLGFDVCSACAVFFFLEQKKNLMRCLRPPHQAFALGHASEVRILSAEYSLPSKPTHSQLAADSLFSCETSGEFANREASSPSLPQTPPSSSRPLGTADREAEQSTAFSGRCPSGQHADPQRPSGVGTGSSSTTAALAPASPEPATHPQHPVSRSPAFTVLKTCPSQEGGGGSLASQPRSLPAPPLHPPQWHLNYLATHAGEVTAHEGCRRRSNGSSSSSVGSSLKAPLPPSTRATATQSRTRASPALSRSSTPGSCTLHHSPVSIRLTVRIAPLGARPIAWVLPERGGEASSPPTSSPAMASLDGLLPPKDWKSRCFIQSEMAYKRQESKLAAPKDGPKGAPDVTPSAKATPVASAAQHKASRSASRGRESDLDEPELVPRTARPKAPQMTPQLLSLHSSDTSSEDDEEEEDTAVVAETHATHPSNPHTAGNSVDTIDDANDVCAVCLRSLFSDQPVIETRCHHFFHVECMEGSAHINGNTCPLCRCPNALPDATRDSVLERNLFHITLQLSEAECAQDSVTVCVGSLLTRRGTFENIMSLSAGRCVVVKRQLSPKRRGAEESQRANSSANASVAGARQQKQGLSPVSFPSSQPATRAVKSSSHTQPEEGGVRPRDKDPRIRAVREGATGSG